MRTIKFFLLTAIMALITASASAQKVCQLEQKGYYPAPYTFIQVQAGGNTVFTNGQNFMDLVNPTFSLGIGRMFSPGFGMRIHVNGNESSSFIHTINDVKTSDYKFKYLNSNVDLILNLTNIFCNKNLYKPLNVYLIGGLGLSYAWDNDEFTALSNLNKGNISEDISNAWGKNTNRESLLGHSVRAGLLLDCNLTKNLSVGIEGDINSLSDRFNSKYNNSDDWMLTAQVSLTYKFGHKKYKKPVVIEEPKPEPAPVVVEEPKPVAKPEPKPEPKPVVKEEPLKETIFYAIRISEPNAEDVLNKVADWCKKYPNKTVTISGYADKGTGNPRINAGYAKARAEKVAAALEKKGVPTSQMSVNSYGDTIQPFAENDLNRCVIIVGE